MRVNKLTKQLALTGLAAIALTGCGTAASTTASATSGSSSGSSGGMSASSSSSGSSASGPAVAQILSDKTAQVLMAASHSKSAQHEATFVLTALTASGKPAAGEPVTFYIGPMVPLSNIPPKEWYASGTPSSHTYIASYSKTTDSKGRATLVLYGQPAKTMEMVGAKIGNLSSYSVQAMHAVGSLDAWWTTPSIAPGAPVGDYATVTPWVATERPHHTVNLSVKVESPSGPVAAADVSFAAKAGKGSATGAASGAASGMSSSSSSGMSSGSSSGQTSSMGSQSGPVISTDASGTAAYAVKTGGAKSVLPIRIVAMKSQSTARISGGMNAELIVP